MRIGIVGAGNIGSVLAALWGRAGHEVLVSFARDQARLERLAAQVGGRAGTPAQAREFGEVLVVSVPWPVVDLAAEQLGRLPGALVLDTTNPYGGTPVPEGSSAARELARRLEGATVVKAFNTLASADLEREAAAPGEGRVAMPICGDEDALGRAEALVRDAGFAPLRTGGLDAAPLQEPGGVLYGEPLSLDAARERLAAGATAAG
jgi:hypothetical protein